MDNQLFSLLAMASMLGGGVNEGAAVPLDDVTDLANGARYIPGDVTMARRRGERVVFFPERQTWRMADGSEVR